MTARNVNAESQEPLRDRPRMPEEGQSFSMGFDPREASAADTKEIMAKYSRLIREALSSK